MESLAKADMFEDFPLTARPLDEGMSLQDLIARLNSERRLARAPSRVMTWDLMAIMNQETSTVVFWDELPEDQWPQEHRGAIIAARDSWKETQRAHEARESRIQNSSTELLAPV